MITITFSEQEIEYLQDCLSGYIANLKRYNIGDEFDVNPTPYVELKQFIQNSVKNPHSLRHLNLGK